MDIFFEKLGMPKVLFWGYVGLIFFMLGSTIECTWFSATLIDLGYGVNFVSTIFSFYGLLVAIVSWISGALVNRFSIRKVMFTFAYAGGNSNCLWITRSCLSIIRLFFFNMDHTKNKKRTIRQGNIVVLVLFQFRDEYYRSSLFFVYIEVHLI